MKRIIIYFVFIIFSTFIVYGEEDRPSLKDLVKISDNEDLCRYQESYSFEFQVACKTIGKKADYDTYLFNYLVRNFNVAGEKLPYEERLGISKYNYEKIIGMKYDTRIYNIETLKSEKISENEFRLIQPGEFSILNGLVIDLKMNKIKTEYGDLIYKGEIKANKEQKNIGEWNGYKWELKNKIGEFEYLGTLYFGKLIDSNEKIISYEVRRGKNGNYGYFISRLYLVQNKKDVPKICPGIYYSRNVEKKMEGKWKINEDFSYESQIYKNEKLYFKEKGNIVQNGHHIMYSNVETNMENRINYESDYESKIGIISEERIEEYDENGGTWINWGKFDEDTVIKRAYEMVNYVKAKDYENYAEYVLPKLIETVGGKEYLIKAVEDSKKKAEEEGFTTEEVTIDKPEKVAVVENGIQARLKQTIKIKTESGFVSAESYLIAFYNNYEKKWYFVDTINTSYEELKMIIEELSPELKFEKSELSIMISEE